MKEQHNYLNSFPNFLAMQRNSFCWFLTEGLTEQIGSFSKIEYLRRGKNYLIFGEEYGLLKPTYSVRVARKELTDYQVKLGLFFEVRTKLGNDILYQTRHSLVTFPLMTPDVSFLINGCERVVVSQILRSPGVYFQKNKTQRRKTSFKAKIPTDEVKLGPFVPPGTVKLMSFDLFLTVTDSTMVIPCFQKPNQDKKNLPYLRFEPDFDFDSRPIILKYDWELNLKKSQQPPSVYFVKCLKLYRILLTTHKKDSKQELIQLFLKWMNLKLASKRLKPIQISSFLGYFNYLSRIVTKYTLLQQKNLLLTGTETDLINNYSQTLFQTPQTNKLLKSLKVSKEKVSRYSETYETTLSKSQTLLHILFHLDSILLTQDPKNLVLGMFSPSFVKQLLDKIGSEIVELVLLEKQYSAKRLSFSTSFKNRLKFLPKNTPPFRHKYLKTKTQFRLHIQEYEIKLPYHKKYEEKELYTATLIPEYGSWIRFGFQKNTKMNVYKYPVKNQEDEIMIQLDKLTQKPLLTLLKEMGLTHSEIYENLQHSEFFYFNQPFLITSKDSGQPQPVPHFAVSLTSPESSAEFTRIFDRKYYRLGRIGRIKVNQRLKLNLSHRLQHITYEDIFAITDTLIGLSISKTIPDDIDHLKNRRVRLIGELLMNLLNIGGQRVARTIKNQRLYLAVDQEMLLKPSTSIELIEATIREFFSSSQLSQYLDQTNPLSSLTHKRRISGLGPGGLNRDRISFAVRDIHPSHYGRICPIETPEGQNVGLIASLTTCAKVNQNGFLETPFWRVINGKVIKTGQPIYLTAEIEDFYKIAPADIITNSENYLTKNLISVRYKQDFLNVTPSEVDFIAISPIQVVSLGAALIPFFEHDDANRALMGSNMQRQSVPLLFSQKPIIGTGLEGQVALDSCMTINAKFAGKVISVTSKKIVTEDEKGDEYHYNLQKYVRSNQETCINHRPIVWEGETIRSGQMLTNGPSITDTELSLGQNVLVGYMPWQGYNFEDAILISEKLVYDDIFTSIHIERHIIQLDPSVDSSEQMTNNIPNLLPEELKHLDDSGIVKIGTFLKPADIVVGKVISNHLSEQLPEAKLLRAIFGSKAQGVKDNSYRLPPRGEGRVVDIASQSEKTQFNKDLKTIYVYVAQIRKIKVGDKIAGRHGNKGIISRILPRQDMPFLPDGTPVDILLNPLGVPSRMNVGQLYECLLGLAGDKLNTRFKIVPFDEMYGIETSRILINKKLRHASKVKNESWLFNPYAPGKMVVIDGRTGTEFENPVTVGKAYMLKLIHLVDDKMHARATGPYSLVTQQPLRGKAQKGGQRFGEMEVWALEGFGAAFTLQELLTIKSDDMEGRNDTLFRIVKGQTLPNCGVPESFKVLVYELRSLGLDMTTYKVERFSSHKSSQTEVNLMETYLPVSKIFSTTSTSNDISL